jgi:hypothetical protein
LRKSLAVQIQRATILLSRGSRIGTCVRYRLPLSEPYLALVAAVTVLTHTPLSLNILERAAQQRSQCVGLSRFQEHSRSFWFGLLFIPVLLFWLLFM